MLISNLVIIQKYNPHKQVLFGILNDFQSVKESSKPQKVWELPDNNERNILLNYNNYERGTNTRIEQCV